MCIRDSCIHWPRTYDPNKYPFLTQQTCSSGPIFCAAMAFHSTADAAHPQTRLGSQAGSTRHPMRPQRPTAGSPTQPAHAPRHAARGTWGCTPPAAASTPACSPPALLQNLKNTSCTHTHSTCSVVAPLYYGFVCATPGASSALCPVLHCTAPLYVGNAHTHTHTHT